MKHILALLAGMLIAAPIAAVTLAGSTLTLDDEDVTDCQKGGGCVLVTRQKLRYLESPDCWSRT